MTTNQAGTAVITGASSGLGKVFAEKLAKQGYDLKLVARRGERLAVIAEDLGSRYGVRVENIVADLGESADLKRVAEILGNDSNITLLVNNAGTATLSKLADTPLERQLEMIKVNITAVTVLTNAVLPVFKKNDKGIFINIASILGIHTLSNSSVYSGTKAFVLSYTSGLQQELKGTNIQAQIVLPSATATEIWDISGVPLSVFKSETVMTAEDCVAAAIQGLKSNEGLTFPSVDDTKLIDAYNDAKTKLFAAAQTGKPASRYI